MSYATQPQYAPPPGLPPTEGRPEYAPPDTPPITVYPNPPPSENSRSDPPPPYTAKATDPLPAWSAPTPRFTDLSASARATDLLHLPLDPPPSCFSTPTPVRIRTRSFEPFRIPSKGGTLSDGFRLLYPSDELGPHGISDEDWGRFLSDLAIAARTASQGLSVMSTSPPPRTSFLRGKAGTIYDSAFGKSTVVEVQDLIHVWNQSAFERRKVKVKLQNKTGPDGRTKDGYELLVEAL
ncbi:hypothetical protein PHLCEN_2v8470 [Hermanssonia centrifuga]|uniref:Uncharacterized protein n=1 Tax=Hermanssonia centrifuga TaxID=98765 RepID=A0A2R6NTN8_9APHY|nr:hypothetical protein PHLCEN_2v8470 [Hermanssonia centrifuga]